MRPFELGRRSPKYLRILLAGLLLAFLLDSVADAAHHHDPAANSAVHIAACGYCLTFGGVADGPSIYHAWFALEPSGIVSFEYREAAVAYQSPTSARPRAPPVH